MTIQKFWSADATLENKIEKHLVDEVNKRGALCWKLAILNAGGFPDRTVLAPVGRIWFIELKQREQRAGRLQRYIHQLLTGLGFQVLLIDTMDKADEFIAENL